ncbi:histidine kinase [Bacillaceae bacterium SAOS 7]|nr:histidine kinase [Bacillaceae bacterium SAOS 7]
MWKQVVGWLLIAMTMIAIIYMVFSDKDTGLVTEQAKDGILDLRYLSKENQLLSLAGEWKFTPGDYVNPATFHQEANNQLVPKEWDADTQYGSYQLKIKMPDHLSEVGFRMRITWSAHTLYVNGEKIAEVGKVGTTKEETVPKNPYYEVYIQPKTEELLVTLHVANFYNARGGIVFPIDFGDAATMKEDVQDDVSIERAAIFMVFVLSIYHLTIFIFRKKEDSFFYSGIYFISSGLMIMTRSERSLLREFPNIPFDFYFRLQDFITFFSFILFNLFIVKMIPSIMKMQHLRLLNAPVAVYSIAILLLPARTLSHLQYVFFYYINLILLVIFIRIIWLIIKKRWVLPKNEIAVLCLILIFTLMYTFSGTLDQLFSSGRNGFNRLGMLGFIMSMNVLLGIRLVNRTKDAENLSKRLEKANIAKDALLEVTTKELKQPLYHAINLTKSVQQKEENKQLHMIEQLMERLLYLVNDLQDFTRMRFQEDSFQLQSTNIKMVVCHIAQLLDFSFSRKKIVFLEDIPDSLNVLADEDRLTQIFYRIMEECSNYSVNGTITVHAKHMNEQHIYLTFDAIGEYEDLYVTTDHSAGFLMGKELLERMNCHLHSKRLENGIQFIVLLPFYEYKKLDSITLAKSEDTWLSSNKEIENRQKLLIVEDDVIHAEVLFSLLSEQYAVTIAYSAPEAISKLTHSEQPFSLVMIDEVMPAMDGIELTKYIRQKASLIELPIIMMTTHDYPTKLETIFSSGANDYVVKPVTKQALLARINAVEQTKQAMTQAVENEMAFLQAQIKPHFLYNALSSIISFCYTDGERAAHLLTMLSSYLRYIFEAGKEGHFASLQKELEIIEAYVEIEKARFGQRLSFSYEVDPALNRKEVHIPSLLIQPIVENAIRHGVFEKEGNGQVHLTIKQIDKSLFIQVVDDGVGMSADQLTKLLASTEQQKGIGFSNVLRRVRDISNGSLTVHSVEGAGTTMSITIPLKE